MALVIFNKFYAGGTPAVNPPTVFTGFPHGGQYLLVSTTRMVLRFGWAYGTN